MVVGSSDEPPPMIPGLPRVHPAGHTHQSVYHAPGGEGHAVSGRVVQRGEGLPGPSRGSHNQTTRDGTSEDQVNTTSF